MVGSQKCFSVILSLKLGAVGQYGHGDFSELFYAMDQFSNFGVESWFSRAGESDIVDADSRVDFLFDLRQDF